MRGTGASGERGARFGEGVDALDGERVARLESGVNSVPSGLDDIGTRFLTLSGVVGAACEEDAIVAGDGASSRSVVPRCVRGEKRLGVRKASKAASSRWALAEFSIPSKIMCETLKGLCMGDGVWHAPCKGVVGVLGVRRAVARARAGGEVAAPLPTLLLMPAVRSGDEPELLASVAASASSRRRRDAMDLRNEAGVAGEVTTSGETSLERGGEAGATALVATTCGGA